jgi:hypothetical protein
MRYRRASQKARMDGKRRTHPRAGSCQGDRQRRCAATARPWHSTEMSELVSSRSRDATRRAACHLTPGPRGAGTNRTKRDLAGALATWLRPPRAPTTPSGCYQAPAPGRRGPAPQSGHHRPPGRYHWLDVAEHEDTTRERYDDLIRRYILPNLGDMRVAGPVASSRRCLLGTSPLVGYVDSKAD